MFQSQLSLFANSQAIITDRGESLTYGELARISNGIIAHYKSGIVFTLCENVIGSLAGYVAFVSNQVPQVLLDGHKGIDILQNLIDIYQPEYIWLPSSRMTEFGSEPIYEYAGYILIEMSYEKYKAKNLNPDLLLCLTTSGSTGSPKFVRLSEKNLLANAKSIAEYLDITDQERPITSLPMYYSYGLSVINSHLITGATILLTNKAVIQKEFWQFAKEQRATSISGVPYTYEMLRRLRIFNMDLPALKTLTQAGGKLNERIAKEYIDKSLESGRQFIVMYGQTEATARMSYLPMANAIEKYSSIGIAIPGGELSLCDASGAKITEPEVDGELIYKGDNVSLGYAENIEDLAKGDENNGMLNTGDIAHRDCDGFFYITGRIKRFVKVWGNRCNLDAIEQLVKSETINCACAGVDDKITVFVTNGGLENKIKSLLTEKTGLNTRAFAIKVVESIPKNASGKTQYSELQKMID